MYRAAVGVDRVGVRAAVEEELRRLDVPCFADIQVCKYKYKYTNTGSFLVQIYNSTPTSSTNLQLDVPSTCKFVPDVND